MSSLLRSVNQLGLRLGSSSLFILLGLLSLVRSVLQIKSKRKKQMEQPASKQVLGDLIQSVARLDIIH